MLGFGFSLLPFVFLWSVAKFLYQVITHLPTTEAFAISFMRYILMKSIKNRMERFFNFFEASFLDFFVVISLWTSVPVFILVVVYSWEFKLLEQSRPLTDKSVFFFPLLNRFHSCIFLMLNICLTSVVTVDSFVKTLLID